MGEWSHGNNLIPPLLRLVLGGRQLGWSAWARSREALWTRGETPRLLAHQNQLSINRETAENDDPESGRVKILVFCDFGKVFPSAIQAMSGHSVRRPVRFIRVRCNYAAGSEGPASWHELLESRGNTAEHGIHHPISARGTVNRY